MPTADSLPRWTWWLPLLLLQMASWLSLPFLPIEGSALWYLPLSLGLAFYFWWGWRVLPALAINALLSAPLWGADMPAAALQALLETVGIAAAGLLLRRSFFDPALSSLNHLLSFMLLGVLPATLLMQVSLAGSLLPIELLGAPWLQARLGQWLLESLGVLLIGIALLTYLTPLWRQRGWALADFSSTRLASQHPVELFELPANLRQLPPWWLLLALCLVLPWLIGGLSPVLGLALVGLTMLALALVWSLPGALCGAALVSLLVLGLPLVRDLLGPAGVEWLGVLRLQLHIGVLLLMIVTLLVGRSLSDLRQALERGRNLQRQLSLAHLAFEASPLSITIADMRQPDMPLIYCNPAFERLTGYTREQILGHNCRFLSKDDQNQAGLAQLRLALQRGEPCQVLLRNYRQDGSLFSNELILAPMHDAHGISHYIALQHDVTAREEQAAQLAAQREELLRQSYLFSQTECIADLGGWVLEVADFRMHWSAGCFRIYELDPQAAAPRFAQVLACLDASGRKLVENVSRRLLAGLERFDIEVRLLTAKGTQRWVRINGMTEHDGGQLVRVYGAIQDISARKCAEQQLRERDERLRLFFEAPLIGMALTSPSYAWEEVNSKLCSILGRSREELLACGWHAISQADDLAIEQPLQQEVLAGTREGYELDKRFVRPDGSLVYTRLNLRAVRQDNGQVSRFLLLVEDISARHQAEARYRTIVEHAPEAILLITRADGVVDCNENALHLFGCSREEILGKTALDLSAPEQTDGRSSAIACEGYLSAAIGGQAQVLEWLHCDRDGRPIPCEVRLVRMPGEQVMIRASITDISERQRYQHEIERLAYSDELTGLPNRRLLLDRLQHAMLRERRENRLGALLFIDLDHFKSVNDSLGHLVGDGLLREVSRRLGSCLRAQDTLARIGGDEFVVLLEALAETPELAAERAGEVGEKLLASLRNSCWIDGHELSIGASIGVTLHPLGQQAAADVLKQADTAMYRAKSGGRNGLRFFVAEMQGTIDQRLQLQSELRQALQRNQLYLVFQPQLELASGRVAGAEALVRWRHPERGEIAPDQFIPLAEETGLIQELGQWVLEQSCAALARWLPHWPQLVLAVNLSPRELRQVECVERIRTCLQRHGLPASALELEITEGVLVEDVEQCIEHMQALKAHGVRFAIDDFGTGYSSLTYLKRLPLDRLKIDRSFVHDLVADNSDQMLVQSILLIAHNLGLECVAEGIENQAQQDILRAHGCALGQGYFLSRPLSEVAFVHWLEQRMPTHSAFIPESSVL
ncbi:MAG: EAL domain-containing protein [Pseudomonas sp.]